ncbi:hypothetical protein CC2G_004379 [Coprinopsis cinerea AmutBmut pab1-1]|nr:hypothetical protein CC2G_004379 [Coprinopsis cinerea AmutBmut pab1-1]
MIYNGSDCTFKALYYTGPGLEYIRGRNSSASEGTEIASHCLFLSYVALGDALLLYRCYIIWNHMWYIIIPQILMFLGFLGLSIGNVGRFVVGTTRSSEDEALKSQRISTAYTSLTVGVNVIATALIAFRIIRAQQAIRRSLPARNMGMYNTAARIIIESALPLAIFGLITVILNIVNWGSDSATDSLTYSTVASIFSSLYASFAALSPQMIIFRVTTGRSHTHYGDLQYSINPATRPLEPIAFGDGHTGHSTDSLSSRLEERPGATVSNEKV